MKTIVMLFATLLCLHPGRAQEAGEEEPKWMVDEFAKFQGGNNRMFGRWIEDNLSRYNDKTESAYVDFSFVVEKDGSLTNFVALRSPDPSLTEEVKRVFDTSPRWEPGKDRGRTVRTKVDVRVDFLRPDLLRAKRETEPYKKYRALHAGPEQWITLDRLRALIPQAQRPIVVLAIYEVGAGPCRSLLQDWDRLSSCKMAYRSVLKLDLYAQSFEMPATPVFIRVLACCILQNDLLV